MTCHNKDQDVEANLKHNPFFSFLAPGWLFPCNTVTLIFISGVHGFLSFTGTYSFILPSINNIYIKPFDLGYFATIRNDVSQKQVMYCRFFLKEELTRMGEIENSLTIFVMATYGEGDPTDNAQEFYEWLQNDRDDLDCLNYTVSMYLHMQKLINFINQAKLLTGVSTKILVIHLKR